MTAIFGRLLVLPPIPVLLQPEQPVEHLRNALMLLAGIEVTSPAVYTLVWEIGRAERRIHAAVVLLDHSGPPQYAVGHIRRAVEILIDAPVDWDIVSNIRPAVARLIKAL